MNNAYQSSIPPGMLMRIIESKQILIVNYEQLLNIASDRQDIELIGKIRLDEATHLGVLIGLYAGLFGEQPSLTAPRSSQINSFIPGIKDSIMSELNLYVTFSNIIFTDTNADVRNTFAQVLADDNRHASRLNFIYSKSIEMKLGGIDTFLQS